MAKERLVLFSVLAALAAALIALPRVLYGSGQDRPIFRTGTRTVAIYATVNDAEGRLVPDLERSAFRILDNGRPVDLTVFSNDVQRITVAIMLDMSASMFTKVTRVRDSAERFIDAMAPGDRACIGTFGQEVAVSPLLTDDKQALKRVLGEELWPGGQTPLWRAVLAGMTSLEAEAGRRVVLVLTDGNDGDPFPSPPKAKDVKQRAIQGDYMLYAIGMERTQGELVDTTVVLPDGSRKYRPKVESGTPGQWSESSEWMFSGGLTAAMVDVVEETGGGHFELKSGTELGDTFARVVAELRHQYLLGFSPAVLDGTLHKLEVQVTRPGCKARARRSYIALKDR